MCNSPVDVHLQTARPINLLSELLNIRDSRDLSLANLSSGDLYAIICFYVYYNFIMSIQCLKFSMFFSMYIPCMYI